jgi:glycosyltransferase involved in cell wall biosynthesis
VCIVTDWDIGVSETFIRAHVERLPARVTVVHSLVPHVGDRPVLSQSLTSRAYRKIWRLLARHNSDWEITAAYIRIFRKSRAAVVLAEYGTTGVRVLDACRRARLPLIVYFRGFDASRRDILDRYKESYRRLFREAAAIIAVSRPMREKLISLGAPLEEVYVNPSGVDCRLFSGADPLAAPPMFLAVGRFVEKKAPQLTLLAFSEVYRACPAARLRMVGDGPLWGACRDLAKALEIDEAVTFCGPQPHPIVQEEMRRARCFVQHSVEAANGDSEGTPGAILEAGASGLPVVATRHAGIPDVVIEGETGFLVDERDVKGMAAHMLRLSQEPALAGQLGRAARERVCQEFSVEKSISTLWRIIEHSVGQHRAAFWKLQARGKWARIVTEFEPGLDLKKDRSRNRGRQPAL